MSTVTIDKIKADIKVLPEKDYVQLRQWVWEKDWQKWDRQDEGVYAPNLKAIDALCGKYRNQLSSSEEFAKQKQAEIELEEQKWQKR